MHDNFKNKLKARLLSGGIWAVVGRGGSAILAVVVNAMLARMLTPQELGGYFLTLSIVSMFAVISQLGLHQAVVRLIASSMEKGMSGRAVSAITIAYKVAFLVSTCVSCVYCYGLGRIIADFVFHSKMLASLSSLISLWVIVIAFQSLFAETFRGFHNIKYAVLFGGLLNAIVLVCLFGLVWFIQGATTLQNVVLYSIAGGITSNVVAIILLYYKVIPKRGLGDISSVEVLQVAWPIWVINLTVFILTQTDMWIVGFFLTKEDVALYGAASRLSQTMMLVTTLLYAFMPPLIAQLYAKGDQGQLQLLLRVGAFANTVLVLPLLVLFVLMPTVVVSVIYGEYYKSAGIVLSLLSIGLFVNVVTGMRGYVLMMCGHERTQMYIALAGGLLNVMACSYGAVIHGVSGVALGAMLSMSLVCMVELFYVKKNMNIWTFASYRDVVHVLR